MKRGEDTASVPEDLTPDELTVEKALQLLAQPKSDTPIGEIDGLPVFAKSGRYGPYVQWGTPDTPPPGLEKPKMASLFKTMQLDQITLADATKLLQLPRLLGKDPADNVEIMANNGRYGPYVQKAKDYRNIAGEAVLQHAVGALLSARRGAQPQGRAALEPERDGAFLAGAQRDAQAADESPASPDAHVMGPGRKTAEREAPVLLRVHHAPGARAPARRAHPGLDGQAGGALEHGAAQGGASLQAQEHVVSSFDLDRRGFALAQPLRHERVAPGHERTQHEKPVLAGLDREVRLRLGDERAEHENVGRARLVRIDHAPAHEEAALHDHANFAHVFVAGELQALGERRESHRIGRIGVSTGHRRPEPPGAGLNVRKGEASALVGLHAACAPAIVDIEEGRTRLARMHEPQPHVRHGRAEGIEDEPREERAGIEAPLDRALFAGTQRDRRHVAHTRVA
ncbi:MAG: topoisomerase C-terminal repeat-containing protein, partial [Planctomycetota bacterium]